MMTTTLPEDKALARFDAWLAACGLTIRSVDWFMIGWFNGACRVQVALLGVHELIFV